MKFKSVFVPLLFTLVLLSTLNVYAKSLTLITNPPQSLVYVDDVLVGQTNEMGKLTCEVNVGSKVKIENVGYFPYTFVFDTSKPATVQVNLKPVSYIFISSTPCDAYAAVDGNEYALPATVTVPAGKHEIMVERDGYISQKIALVSPPFGVIKRYFRLEKSGKVTITTSPSRATLLLDDEFSAITPFSTYLKSGPHSIYLSMNGYSPISTTIVIPKESTPLNMHFNLKKLLKITVISSPANAVITMASTTFVTPATLTLIAGRYAYTAHQEYSYPSTGEIFIRKSGKYIVNLQPKMGLVVFTSNPMGAAVNLNGKFIGQTQKSLRLAYGKYHVKMVGNAGKIWFGDFTLEQNIKTIYADMVNSGMVLVNAYPSTNTIVHIGQVWTSVPATLNAAVGVYKVEFFNPKYPTLSRYIEVKAGRISRVDVSLQPMSTFFVMTYPLNALISLDGEVIGRSPIFGVKVKSGEHLLSIKWEDAKMEKKIIMEKDKVYKFTFTDPNSVKVMFISYPDPLKLILDGKEKGYTPISIQLGRGDHSYQAYDVLGTEVASGTLNTTYFSSRTYFFLNGR